MTILSILVAVLVFGLLVFIHELGHYSVARALGFKVEEFAIGFGPLIFSKEKNDIRYSVRALPLGGYCKFYGEDQDNQNSLSFNAQKAWKRFLVIAAGPVVNIVFAFIVSVIILVGFGDYATTIHSVNQNSSAQKAGIEVGDSILAIDGKELVFGANPAEILQKSKNNYATLTVSRNGKEMDIVIDDLYDSNEGRKVMGVTIAAGEERKEYSLGQAIKGSFAFTGYFFDETVNAIKGIFTKPEIRNQVMGPVGTIGLIGEVARTGFEPILRITVLLSLNLGLMNLLPFPGLDGSRLVFILIEMIFRKPVSRNVEGYIHFAGMIVLFAFMLYFTVFDVGRLIGG